MSYEPTNWKDGDLVTSAKLNKIEQGIANGVLVVVITITDGNSRTTYTMDKTWKQIHDAAYAIFCHVEEDNGAIITNYHNIIMVGYAEGDGYGVVVDFNGEPLSFSAETEDDVLVTYKMK